MGASAEDYVLGVMSGRQRGVGPALLRAGMRIVEPIYTGIVSWRNRRWDRGVGVKSLPRPVVSVGNVTAGGTGKTPVVKWLCDRLLCAGRFPAVLSRGYKTADEPEMLREMFEGHVPVGVNPSRFEGGTAILSEHPSVDTFVLDDGFQHRKLARDFDLVLVNAAEPFGFGHVHPRGLLREPLKGLGRADAILITHVEAVGQETIAMIENEIRRFNAKTPIYRCAHEHVGVKAGNDHKPMDWLRGKKVMVVSGIGDPERFEKQVEHWAELVSQVRRGDHSSYSADDVKRLDDDAAKAGAELIVTTEKDWGKMKRAGAARIKTRVWRVELAIAVSDSDEEKLLSQILEQVTQKDPGRAPDGRTAT
jgi:tetraacyldisaccharide 4'-kinase